ncbi:response regulator [Chthonobacter rhizosphaerae]|uniref:response regulator n=1 Tax=Chthonobacter rhizosphaerae TaxID=2735553 RepID=UPI0015EF31A5|nr:response regulator [Chthonobacter rhizosphaerae]
MTTILVADDEYLIADILAFALEDLGYTVVSAGNGRKALDLFRSFAPALVITDYMMPVMNGLELAEAIRRTPGGTVPILLMSGAQAEIARARGDLFTHVFDKPFVVERMVSVVRELVGPPSKAD